MDPPADGEHAHRVVLVNTEVSLRELLGEWLAPHGCTVIHDELVDDSVAAAADVVVVDVPFPRNGGLAMLERIAAAYPGAPIVALSSNFFAGVEANGALARALGVASVLPVPVTQFALTAAVLRLLPD